MANDERALSGSETTIRPLLVRDLDQASRLALRVFAVCVGPGCDPEGRTAFASCVSPKALEETRERGELLLGAFTDGKMAGMLVVRRPGHVANLFVETPRQRLGLGRALFEEALRLLRDPDGREPAMTVNASLNAARFYERLGFSRTGGETRKSGLRFIPMRREPKPEES